MKLDTLFLSLSLLFFGYSFQKNSTKLAPHTSQELFGLKTTKPVFSTTLNGHLSSSITLDSLQLLKNNVVLYKDQSPAEGYEIQSFVVILVPKRGEPDVRVHSGSQLEEGVLTSIKQLKAGDRILLDQIKVKTPTEGVQHFAPKIYTVIE